MGVATTHYVVLGVAITEEAQIKEFIHSSEEHLEFMDGYYDNGYREEITPNESGIHVIVDGMSGKYIVVGKILAKGIEVSDIGKQYRKFYPKVLKLDQVLGTQFGSLDAKVIAFTHWH